MYMGSFWGQVGFEGSSEVKTVRIGPSNGLKILNFKMVIECIKL